MTGKLDWNDLHCQYGLEVVREQLLAGAANEPMIRMAGAPDDWSDLPPAPSDGESAPSAAAPEEGAGEGWTLQKVKARFALVEGETKVFDLYRKVVIKKTGFETLVSKPIASAWFDLPDKKGIEPDHAKRIEAAERLGKRAKLAEGEKGPSMFWRYVYLDGSTDIYDRHLQRRLPEKAVKLALGDTFSLWVNSDQRQVIPEENLIFDPCMRECPADIINTFDGLPLQPVPDPERCQGMVGLLRFLCNGHREALHWLTCWLAYPLQHVGAKLDTAVLMHSTMEGSGKSLLFGDIMRPMYGSYGATVGQAQLESNWTAWQSNKLYGLFEEVVSRDQRYNQVGKIKHMVTGKTVRIESKFVNGWEEANYMNAVFLSNEIMPWPIGENDRRMLVLWPEKTLPEKAQKRIGWELENGGVEAFYQYLLDYDLGEFNQRTRPPNTPARQRLVELSRAAWDTFYNEWKYGLLGAPFDVCLTSDLYGLYLEWCDLNKEHTVSQTRFSQFIATKPDIEKSDVQIAWQGDCGTRIKSMMFVPEVPLEVDLTSRESVGRHVRKWRLETRSGGWQPEKWRGIRGFNPPADGSGEYS